MIKEKDIEMLESLLKEATEKVEKMKKSILCREVVKIKMIDGLTGETIHVAKIREENPSDAKIAQCKKNMVSNYLWGHAYNAIAAKGKGAFSAPGWNEAKDAAVKKQKAKIKDNLKWEVIRDVE